MFQGHNQVVTLELKSGEEVKAFEPHIDDVIDVAWNPKIVEKCGEITTATE